MHQRTEPSGVLITYDLSSSAGFNTGFLLPVGFWSGWAGREEAWKIPLQLSLSECRFCRSCLFLPLLSDGFSAWVSVSDFYKLVRFYFSHVEVKADVIIMSSAISGSLLDIFVF